MFIKHLDNICITCAFLTKSYVSYWTPSLSAIRVVWFAMDSPTKFEQNGGPTDDKVVQFIQKDAEFSNDLNDGGKAKRKYNLNTDKNKADTLKQEGFFQRYKSWLPTARNYSLLVVYLAYYSYAMFCNFGDEPSIRLTVFTIFGIIYLGWNKMMSYEKLQKVFKSVISSVHMTYKYGSRPKVIRWYVI